MREEGRELQRGGLAAANLPEGDPDHAAAEDRLSMGRARGSRPEREELPTAHQFRSAPLPRGSRRSRSCGAEGLTGLSKATSDPSGTGDQGPPASER
jgi:hypothetical protein